MKYDWAWQTRIEGKSEVWQANWACFGEESLALLFDQIPVLRDRREEP